MLNVPIIDTTQIVFFTIYIFSRVLSNVPSCFQLKLKLCCDTSVKHKNLFLSNTRTDENVFFLITLVFLFYVRKSSREIRDVLCHIKDDYVIFHEYSSLRCKVLSFSTQKNLFLLLRTRNELKTNS